MTPERPEESKARKVAEALHRHLVMGEPWGVAREAAGLGEPAPDPEPPRVAADPHEPTRGPFGRH